MKKPWFLIVSSIVLILLSGTSPVYALGDEAREIIMENIGKFGDLADFGSKPVAELLDDTQFEAFFENFGRVLAVAQLADKVASAKDAEALQMIGGELAKQGMKALSPEFDKAFGWFMWAKKGMEFFKDFVFDPWIQREAVETYQARRSEGQDPLDAFPTVVGWWHVRDPALKQLEKQGYNMNLLWVDGEKGKLSEVWERKLEAFVMAEFELQYHKELVRKAGERAKSELPGLVGQLRSLLQTRATPVVDLDIYGWWEGRMDHDEGWKLKGTIHFTRSATGLSGTVKWENGVLGNITRGAVTGRSPTAESLPIEFTAVFEKKGMFAAIQEITFKGTLHLVEEVPASLRLQIYYPDGARHGLMNADFLQKE